MNFGIVCLYLGYIVLAENLQMFKKLLKHVDFAYALFGEAWY